MFQKLPYLPELNKERYSFRTAWKNRHETARFSDRHEKDFQITPEINLVLCEKLRTHFEGYTATDLFKNMCIFISTQLKKIHLRIYISYVSPIKFSVLLWKLMTKWEQIFYKGEKTPKEPSPYLLIFGGKEIPMCIPTTTEVCIMAWVTK